MRLMTVRLRMAWGTSKLSLLPIRHEGRMGWWTARDETAFGRARTLVAETPTVMGVSPERVRTAPRSRTVRDRKIPPGDGRPISTFVIVSPIACHAKSVGERTRDA